MKKMNDRTLRLRKSRVTRYITLFAAKFECRRRYVWKKIACAVSYIEKKIENSNPSLMQKINVPALSANKEDS